MIEKLSTFKNFCLSNNKIFSRK